MLFDQAILILKCDARAKQNLPEYTNSPTDGVCGYEGDRDTEKQYFPGNNFKFKKAKTKGQKNIVPFIEYDEFDTDDYEGDLTLFYKVQ